MSPQTINSHNSLNHNITLNEFKFIFFMEWAHRMVGRFIGLAFVVPGAYFAYKGYMSPAMKTRSFFIATLIGLQASRQLSSFLSSGKRKLIQE
jgi:heme A synthase